MSGDKLHEAQKAYTSATRTYLEAQQECRDAAANDRQAKARAGAAEEAASDAFCARNEARAAWEALLVPSSDNKARWERAAYSDMAGTTTYNQT